MHTRTIAVTTHGRYLVTPAASAVGFLVGFHGYAHNAAVMLDELRKVPGASRWTLVSIQGLHRFYNRENQVVASWMTREDRDLAIGDNVAYVDAVLDEVSREHGPASRLVVAGFSQGTAMAYRAAALARRRADAVIALAGDIPPELAGGSAALPRVLIGRGTGDTWYTRDKLATDLAALERLGTPVESLEFDGGHEWAPPFRDAAGRFLSAIAAGEP